ncbi:hypothetical protein NW752_004254 [Fusarium irregulare]|uniref:Uncharacterized protein n=1 Tax=Fusarium irregulare TaxID=2494466 RepID=A0A9W8U903_9HYPO|nr:hypothetical protein NW766_007156 [Fusarium irregulare]KAJ4021247.1 hypothetical protein NW752_004254 [Fusarium irregulare]
MSDYDDLPTPPPSDDESDYSSEEAEPRLTPQELGALFLDFYTFLTTLHFNEAHLKIPPPSGWEHITPESYDHFKSDYAIEVIRHLPYFSDECRDHIHYKSRPLDLTAYTQEDLKYHKEYDTTDTEFWSSEDQQDPSDVFCFTRGFETYGRTFYLLVNDCEIIEDMNKAFMLSSVPVEEFFEKLKEDYRTLKLIPGKGRITREVEHVPESEGRIARTEVDAQTEDWGTDLDIQYLRQIYRDYGWPSAFDVERATEVVNEWMGFVAEFEGDGPGLDRSYGWETAD